MRFMVHWQIHPDKRPEVFSAFANMDLADYQSQSGPNINLLQRWHDVMNGTGVAIFETDDQAALTTWLLQWTSVCDFEMLTALTDEEAHELVKATFPQG